MTRRSTSEGLVSAIRVTAGLWCVNHEQGVRSERVHDRVDVPAGCGSTPGSSDCARVGPLSSRLTAKREDVGARAFGTSGNARMHGCEQRELRRQSPTALCSDGASGAAHRGPCRSTWLRAYHPSHSHPSSLVSCLTVGRDASRDISASATLTQPLSLALMSPDGSDRERSPLEPVKDNILLAQPVRSPLIALHFGNRRWRCGSAPSAPFIANPAFRSDSKGRASKDNEVHSVRCCSSGAQRPRTLTLILTPTLPYP